MKPRRHRRPVSTAAASTRQPCGREQRRYRRAASRAPRPTSRPGLVSPYRPPAKSGCMALAEKRTAFTPKISERVAAGFVFYPQLHSCGGSEVRIHSCGESEMRTSEPKPHQINKLLVSFDSEVRKTSAPQNGANFGIGTLED